MLGERYVATRKKLLDSLAAVAVLADDVGVVPSTHWNIEALRSTVERPFLFTVCGEINAGKSSLINAISGKYLCQVNALPQTDRPTFHCYGAQRREVDHSGKWRECAEPELSLQNLHWLDLPGIDAVGKAAAQDWSDWLQASDVILVVFPFRNPWGNATWDFLTRLPTEVMERVAFVLQQCDEGQQVDLPVMLGHLNDLAMKRIGRMSPVFAVSARVAFEAKTQRKPASVLAGSGLPVLEQWLQERMDFCPQRREALESLRRAALGIMQEIEEELDRVSRKVHHDVRFLENLEQEISLIHQNTVRQQMQGLGAIGEVFSQQSHDMARLLKKRLGIFRSMVRVIRGEDTAQRLELILQEHLTAAVEAAAARDMGLLIGECESHWQTVEARIIEQTGACGATWSSIEKHLQESREHFVARMGRASTLNIGQLRVRGLLEGALRERNRSLAVWMGFCFVTWMIAGIAGGMSLAIVPQVAAIIATIFFLLLAVFCWRSAREIVQDYRERLLRSADGFFMALRGDYEEGLRLFFRQYAEGLESVRKTLAQRGSLVQPLMQRWNEQFLELKAIEQEMVD